MNPIYILLGLVFILSPEILLVGVTFWAKRWLTFIVVWVIAASVMGFQLWLAGMASGISVATSGEPGSGILEAILSFAFVLTTIVCALGMSSRLKRDRNKNESSIPE